MLLFPVLSGPSTAAQTVQDEESATFSSGWTAQSGVSAYNADWRYSTTAGTAAIWTFNGLAAGYYDIYVSASQNLNLTTFASWITSDAGGVTRHAENQGIGNFPYSYGRLTIADGASVSRSFGFLGSVYVGDGAFSLTLTNLGGVIGADAVALQAASLPRYFLTQGDSGVTRSGSFAAQGSPAGMGAADMYYSRQANAYVDYVFSGLQAGATYKAALAWAYINNFYDDIVPVQILTNGVVAFTTSVNMRQAGGSTNNVQLWDKNFQWLSANALALDSHTSNLTIRVLTDGSGSGSSYIQADSAYLQMMAIPEPSAWALVAVGLVGGFCLRRRR